MTSLIRITLCLFSFIVLGNAQKIDLDPKTVTTQIINLPAKTLPADVQTYSVVVNGGSNLQEWGFNAEQMAKQYGTLHGFQKVATNGQLRWVFEVSQFRFVGNEVKSTSSTSKDKAGRETTTYTYWYELTYVYGVSAQLIDEKATVLNTYSVGEGQRHIHKSSDYSTYKAALDAYNSESSKVKTEVASNSIASAFSASYHNVNNQFGYQPTRESFRLYITDSPKHPENEAFMTNVKEAKRLFETLKADRVSDSAKVGLDKIKTYFKGVAEKYTSTEKADIKLRYASYYNNAQICQYLDNPDESSEWAKKLIANDFDKKDGERLIKNNDELKDRLKKSNQTSRRFQRLKADKTVIDNSVETAKN